MSMGRRRLPRNGWEQDAFGWWGRKFLCYIGRAGVRDSIKRGYRRRERHEAKRNIRNPE
jgi:hypothetical protein